MNHSTHRHFLGCFNLASLCTNLKLLTQITVLCNSYVNKIIVLWECYFIYSHSAGVDHKPTTAKLPFICLAVCHRVRSQSLTLSGPVVKDSRDLRIILVSVSDLHHEFEQQASPLWARYPPLFFLPLSLCVLFIRLTHLWCDVQNQWASVSAQCMAATILLIAFMTLFAWTLQKLLL